MTEKHDHDEFAGGPGWSGTARASEAASRTASDADAAPGTVGNEARDPAAAPLPWEKQAPVAEPVREAEQAPLAAPETAGAPPSGGDGRVDGVGVDHERKVEFDLDELVARAEKADHHLELAQRTKADFENYRKRAAREAAAAQERGVAKLARELLPAVDNLDRALAAIGSADPVGEGQAATNGDGTLASGIKLVHADVIAALARVGIEPFSPVGEPFDPQYHEAVAQQAFEGAEPGTVVEVYQRGYRIGESVLRPARVLVAG